MNGPRGVEGNRGRPLMLLCGFRGPFPSSLSDGILQTQLPWRNANYLRRGLGQYRIHSRVSAKATNSLKNHLRVVCLWIPLSVGVVVHAQVSHYLLTCQLMLVKLFQLASVQAFSHIWIIHRQITKII